MLRIALGLRLHGGNESCHRTLAMAAGIAGLLLGVAAGAADPGDKLDEIVVTANKLQCTKSARYPNIDP